MTGFLHCLPESELEGPSLVRVSKTDISIAVLPGTVYFQVLLLECELTLASFNVLPNVLMRRCGIPLFR